MNGLTRVSNSVQDLSEVLSRMIEALGQIVLLVVLVCFALLVIAGTYGILHPGDDFGFGSGSGGGDIIVPIRGKL